MTTDKKIPENRKLEETNEIGVIASFFGFSHIKPPHITKKDIEATKNFNINFLAKEKSALTHMYFEEKMMANAQPVMFYVEHPFPGSGEKKKSNRLEASLITMGSAKSVSECISIQTAINALNKLGYKNLTVHLNSIGDKESISEFQRKLNTFIKKNMNSFPTDLRQILKKDIYGIFKYQKKEWECFSAECPKSIDFLSEQSRQHFKEVLEFLEIMEVPYVINSNLIGDSNIGSETVYEIREDDEVLATGMRFNRLAKKIGYKKDLASNILHISIKLKKSLKKVKIKKSNPQFYLIQFGPEAKLKSFIILKQLYKANVTVSHAIAKDKLGSQISVAESSGIPYIILIGQKEAIENSVIIRNNSNRAQTVIPIPELASKIKDFKQ